MIHKQLDQIEKADIDELVASGTSEIKTLDFKLTLPGNADADKKEFLADVSSFANASGGDLIFGVAASSGVATSAPGLSVASADAEIQRLDSLIRDGIAPRMPGVQLRPIPGFSNGPVIIARMPKSWASPHMVTYKNTSRFFARNNAGKYQLDVAEIRASFLLSESIPERIRNFRLDRLAKIAANEGPMRLLDGPKLVLHLIPVASMTGNVVFDLSQLKRQRQNLHPLGETSNTARVNIDGYVVAGTSESEAFVYCQCFRNGIIESVDCTMTCHGTDAKLIPSTTFEQDLLAGVESYLRYYREMEMTAPAFLMLSLLGFRGYQMAAVTRTLTGHVPPIDRDLVNVPEIILEDYGTLAVKLIRPMLDMVWNAAGWDKSPNFDDQGNWQPQR
jgi:hypothetical protein